MPDRNVCVHGWNDASEPMPGNYAHDGLARDRSSASDARPPVWA
jgi:hypothetical protein